MRLALLFFLLSVFLIACYYDKEEEIYIEEFVYVNYDTVTVSYATDIEPVINNNCYSCHGSSNPQANIRLNGYSNFSEYALRADSKLLCAIKHESSCSPMPQPFGKLSNTSIIKIEKWIFDGASNN